MMHNETYFFADKNEREMYENRNHRISLNLKNKMYNEIALNARMTVEELDLSEICISSTSPERDSRTALVIFAEAVSEIYIYILNGNLIEGTCRIQNKPKEALIDIKYDDDTYDDDLYYELDELAELMCDGNAIRKIYIKPSSNNQEEWFKNEKRAAKCGYIPEGNYAVKYPEKGGIIKFSKKFE